MLFHKRNTVVPIGESIFTSRQLTSYPFIVFGLCPLHPDRTARPCGCYSGCLTHDDVRARHDDLLQVKLMARRVYARDDDLVIEHVYVTDDGTFSLITNSPSSEEIHHA